MAFLLLLVLPLAPPTAPPPPSVFISMLPLGRVGEPGDPGNQVKDHPESSRTTDVNYQVGGRPDDVKMTLK